MRLGDYFRSRGDIISPPAAAIAFLGVLLIGAAILVGQVPAADQRVPSSDQSTERSPR